VDISGKKGGNERYFGEIAISDSLTACSANLSASSGVHLLGSAVGLFSYVQVSFDVFGIPQLCLTSGVSLWWVCFEFFCVELFCRP